MIDCLLTIAEQFELLAAKIADLQELQPDSCEASGRLEAAQGAVRRGLVQIHAHIESVKAAHPRSS